MILTADKPITWTKGGGGARQLACEYVALCFQYPHKALWEGSFVVHWLTHVGVVLQASISSRVLLVEPFPTVGLYTRLYIAYAREPRPIEGVLTECLRG